jgi:hypothetical protein
VYFVLVVDSFGKIPSGILKGAINWPGEYRECLNVTSMAVAANWTSKYCSISPKGAESMAFYISYGMCVPAECTSSDIASILNSGETFDLRFPKAKQLFL